MGDERLHVRVGFATIVVLGVAVALVIAMEGRHLRPGIVVHVELDRTGPLTEGARVIIAGRQIGTIDRIRLLPRRDDAPAPSEDDPTAERARVVLDVWVDRRWAWVLHENSEFFLNQPSILGEAYLEVGPPRGGAEPGPPLRDGATVRGVDPPRLDRIAQKSYENLRAVTELLRDGLPEARELGRALDELGRTLDALEATPGDWRTLSAGRVRLFTEGLAAWRTYQEIGVTPDDVTTRVDGARWTIARARADLLAVRARLEPLLDNVEALRRRLDPDRFAEFATLVTRTEKLLARSEAILGKVEAIVAFVESGQGTIGAFLRDDELADDTKAMLKLMKHQPWVTVGHPQ